MGMFIPLTIEQLRPIQHGLVRRDFQKLLNVYDAGKFSEVLPGVAQHIHGDVYAVINGTHRTLMWGALGVDSPSFYVPEHAQDFIKASQFSAVPLEFIEETNNMISDLFDYCYMDLSYTQQQGIRSFADLQESYGLHTLDDIRRFASGAICHRWALDSREIYPMLE